MIVDSLENAHRYLSLHPLFAAAFEYIQQSDLNALEDGKWDIGEGLKAIMNTAPGKAKEDSIAKFECHNKNIDIQVCISGAETLGWKPRGTCEQPKAEYNAEKDVMYYNDAPDTYFQLTDRQFAIFFPEDVHAPMIGSDIIKKLVVKVKL